MTALGAFARFPWIRAAVSLMGSGYYRALAQTLFPPLGEEGEALSPAAFTRTAVLAEYELEGRLAAIAEAAAAAVARRDGRRGAGGGQPAFGG